MEKDVTQIAISLATLFTAVAAVVTACAAYDTLNSQKEKDAHQYADKVYLGEIPAYESSRTPGPGKSAIINASGIQIAETWAKYEDGHVVVIYDVERCGIYALPGDVKPTDLYFTDPNGHWHRPYGKQAEKTESVVVPIGHTDSPWNDTIRDCAG